MPQIGLGSELLEGGYLLDKLDKIHADLGFSSYTTAFDGPWDKANVFFVTLALMAGTAGLPHVIVRFYTVKTVRAARSSAFWALFFIALPLSDGAGHRSLRPLLHDRLASGKAGRPIAGMVPKLGEDRIDPVAG